MRSRSPLYFLSLLITLICTPAVAEDKPTLTVYTYSSFTADWGPGPAIKAAFEAECDCTLEFVALDDAVSLLSRIRLEGEHTEADVVLGLDMNLVAEAADTGLFAPHGIDLQGLSLPLEWQDSTFVPFDYGYFAFVYDKERLQNPPTSMEQLVNGDPEEKILIQDPRTSTPGLGLMLWVRKVYGDDAGEAWTKLKERVLTVSKGWSEAYGLFLEGEAPLVLSYTTSPAYHLIAEEDSRFAAAGFEEGHYLQIEVGGRLASSEQPELAQQFLEFMVSPGFQNNIPTGNWMYPATTLDGGLPAGFEALHVPSVTLLYTPKQVQNNRKAWEQEWLEIMSR